MCNDIHSVSPCLELFSVRQSSPHCNHYVQFFQQVPCTYRVLNYSLFASGLFHVFKELSRDRACWPYNTHSSLRTTALAIEHELNEHHTHTKCVTWLNSAEWAALVVSPATCLMHEASKGGLAAASIDSCGR